MESGDVFVTKGQDPERWFVVLSVEPQTLGEAVVVEGVLLTPANYVASCAEHFIGDGAVYEDADRWSPVHVEEEA